MTLREFLEKYIFVSDENDEEVEDDSSRRKNQRETTPESL